MRKLLESAWECMSDPEDSVSGMVIFTTLWIAVLETPLLIWRFC